MEQQGVQRLLVISVTALALMGATAYYLRYTTPSHPQEVEATYTLCTQNVGSINNNPLEYTTVLHNLTRSNDPQLVAAAKTMLRIDSRINPSLPIITIIDREVLYNLCHAMLVNRKKAIQQQVKQEGQGYDLDERTFLEETINAEVHTFVDAFVEEHKEMAAHDFFLKKKYGKTLDKPMRTFGVTRFSPTFYDAGMIAYLKQAKTFDEQAFATQWIASVAPHVNRFMEQTENKQTFFEDLFRTYLFDARLTRNIIQQGGGKAWVQVVQHLQASPLGNPQMKDAMLANNYDHKFKATILTLNEAGKNLVHKLIQEHGYWIAKDEAYRLQEPNNTIYSVILYKHGIFPNATVERIPITSQDIARYAKTLDPGYHDIFKRNELNLNLVKNGKEWYFIASGHADSKGDITLHYLAIIFGKHKELEAHYQRTIHLLAGLDANTTRKGTKGKYSYQMVEHLVRKYGYVLIRQKVSENQEEATTKKERSFFQVQEYKIHSLSNEVSDIIIISPSVAVQATFMSEYGLSTSNPSDHKAIGIVFATAQKQTAGEQEKDKEEVTTTGNTKRT